MHEELVKTSRGFSIYTRMTDGKEPAVVFIHGLSANCTQWQAQQVDLEKRGIASLSMDLLGTGNSEKPMGEENYSMPLLAQDIIDITKHKKIVIVAHSMGALPALIIAQKQSHKVKGLLLIQPVFENPLKSGRLSLERLEPLVEYSLKLVRNHVKDNNICLEPNMPDVANSHIKELFASIMTAPPRVQLELIRQMTKWKPDFTVHTKMLIVGGKKDLLVDEKKLHEFVGSINAEYKSIDAEHTVIIDNPSLIIKIIEEFYTKIVS